MAIKNHRLDDRIRQAAWAEFLEHGFQGASLHKISERAGTTTGAIYTRYKGKDDLFCSLIHDTFSQLATEAQPLRDAYHTAQQNRDIDQILAAIRQEEQFYLDLLFRHYEECVLFFCRSDGSSIEGALKKMMSQKAGETIRYLQSLSDKDVNLDGIEFIMTEQFHHYRQILERGYTRQQAVACMKTMEIFQEAGWRALFETLL